MLSGLGFSNLRKTRWWKISDDKIPLQRLQYETIARVLDRWKEIDYIAVLFLEPERSNSEISGRTNAVSTARCSDPVTRTHRGCISGDLPNDQVLPLASPASPWNWKGRSPTSIWTPLQCKNRYNPKSSVLLLHWWTWRIEISKGYDELTHHILRLQYISQGIKLCVFSRVMNALKPIDELYLEQKIYLHRLTEKDINRVVSDG